MELDLGDIRKLSAQQRHDLIIRLHATKRIIDQDMAAAKSLIREGQTKLNALQARMDDVEHSLGWLNTGRS